MGVVKRKSIPLGNQRIKMHTPEPATRDRSGFDPDRCGHVYRQEQIKMTFPGQLEQSKGEGYSARGTPFVFFGECL